MNSIAIYSDLICPWCYIGKRRMEEALQQLPAATQVSRSWHPFQLNPEMPREGLNRKMYRSKKFGSWERSRAMDAQVTAAGKSVGIEFRYDLQTHTPNTFDSHRLVWLAGTSGVQDAVVEALFRAYFCEGVNFADPQKLIEVGVRRHGRCGVETFLHQRRRCIRRARRRTAGKDAWHFRRASLCHQRSRFVFWRATGGNFSGSPSNYPCRENRKRQP